MYKGNNDDIKNLCEKLKNAFGDNYEIETYKEIQNLNYPLKKEFKIVIYNKKKPLVAIEVNNFLFNMHISLMKEIGKDEIYIKPIRLIGIPYAIFYCGKDEKTLFYITSTNELKEMTLDDIICCIKNRRNFGKRPEIIEISNLLDFEKNYFSNFIENIKDLINTETLEFDENKGEINLKKETEDKFFKSLLPQIENNELCRYTSIYSLFKILNEKTVGLVSITCMNDRGELTYSDKQIGNYIYSLNKSKVREDNNCFILSCCNKDKEDDLTMWRLYGDSAQGTCLCFDITKNDTENLFLAPISYGESEKVHKELEFIKYISNIDIHGWKFIFKRWHIWKHFFKSYIFKDEQEIRLLYQANDDEEDDEIKWIRDNTNGIISRIKIFKLGEDSKLPLKLKKAIIGPKCNELESVVTQLNYMNDLQKVIESQKDAILKSGINDFR